MKKIRRLLEKITRIFTYKRRLPEPFQEIQIYVTPDAALKYLKPGKSAFDLQLLDVVTKFVKKDDIVWDIGANLGLFGFAAAHLSGNNNNVYLIEPDIKLCSLVKKSIKIQKNKITLIVVAVFENVGLTDLQIASRGRVSNFISKVEGRSMTGGLRDSYKIPTVSLDFLSHHLNSPDFIKIDIEGAELMALKGARDLMMNKKPTIYCEVGENVAKQVSSLIQGFGYEIYDPGKVISSENKLDYCIRNSLFVHNSKIGKFKNIHASNHSGPQIR